MIKFYTISSCALMVLAYSFNSFLWDGAYYHLVSLGLLGMTRVIYLLQNNRFNLFVNCLAFSNFLDELLFDPTKIDWNEYAMALITFYIVFRWMK